MRSITNLLFGIGVFAASLPMGWAEDYCTLDTAPYKKVIPLGEESVDLFLQAVNNRYLMFLGGKQLFDLETGKSLQLTNEFDPFPGADGKVYVQSLGHSLFFRSIDDALKNGPRAKLIYTDKEMKGTYQSVGVISTNNVGPVYRVVTQYGNMRDYQITLDSEGVPVKVTPIQENVVHICSNLFDQNGTVNQPIVSKDGTEIAMNYKGSTQIYKIDAKSGDCTFVDDLKVGMGKVNFSADGKKLAFSAEHFSAGPNQRKFSGNQIFVYDRASKKLQPASPESRDSRYAAFLPNGDLAFQEQVNGQRRLVVVDSNKFKGPALHTHDPCDVPLSAQIETQERLKEIYKAVCSNQGKAKSGADYVFLPLGREKCLQMVTKYKGRRNQGLSTNDLAALCAGSS